MTTGNHREHLLLLQNVQHNGKDLCGKFVFNAWKWEYQSRAKEESKNPEICQLKKKNRQTAKQKIFVQI